jgi:hypothetical protein
MKLTEHPSLPDMPVDFQWSPHTAAMRTRDETRFGTSVGLWRISHTCFTIFEK